MSTTDRSADLLGCFPDVDATRFPIELLPPCLITPLLQEAAGEVAHLGVRAAATLFATGAMLGGFRRLEIESGRTIGPGFNLCYAVPPAIRNAGAIEPIIGPVRSRLKAFQDQARKLDPQALDRDIRQKTADLEAVRMVERADGLLRQGIELGCARQIAARTPEMLLPRFSLATVTAPDVVTADCESPDAAANSPRSTALNDASLKGIENPVPETPSGAELPPVAADTATAVGKVATRMVKLDDIRVDGRTQTRAEMDAKTVSEYAGEMEDGTLFPPVILYFDGADHWLGDGFHRYWAAHKLDRDILAEIRPGGFRDALKYALAANSKNGLRRTNADKRKAVEMALHAFSDQSDHIIAEMCGVTHPTVGRVRGQLENFTSSSGETTTRASAQTTARVGKDKKVRKSPQTKQKSVATDALPEKSVELESDGTVTPPNSTPVPATTVAKPMMSGESYKLGNGEIVGLPSEGFLTGVHLKHRPGKDEKRVQAVEQRQSGR